MERRLAAILAADVVGYTRLMGADEAGTLRRLTDLRRQVLEPLIAEHHGRVVKLMGDGLLVEFASVVDALTCAVAWHNGVVEREAASVEDKPLKFRIGINLGDVIVEGDDIHGDGVNIAARLEALAKPGGICVSAKVYDEVANKLGLGFEDLGAPELKNVAEPVHVYRVVPQASEAGAPGGAESLQLPEKPSIAVLPFDNMSGDPEQEYFSDGISEDIITALSRFRWFFVIARNSSFTYKRKAVSVTEVAQELGVRYVLEGSVRKAGNRVRISAQLIDATTGNHIWAERYDRELKDIFALQDEITSAIVTAVEPELAGAERDRATRKPPGQIGAWDLYQQGMWHLWRFTAADAAKARAHFEKAIDTDPHFAAAHAGLAYNLFLSLIIGFKEPSDASLMEALKSAQRAIEIDEKDAFAHFALGRVQMMRGEFDEAIAEIERALELNPNLSLAWYALGFVLYFADRSAEAIPHFDRAMRMSPNDPALWAMENAKGMACWQLEQPKEALVWQLKASRHPNCDFSPHASLASLFIELDRPKEARAAIDIVLEKQPDMTVTAVQAMFRAARVPRVFR